jgi:hypothetical protein
MKIKQLVPVTNDYAVLATTAEHFHELCYDRKLDDYNYFWALLDSEDEYVDEVALLEIASDGAQRICDRTLVVEKQNCPICGQKMHPYYDGKHKPNSWQECKGCGYVLNTDWDPEAERFAPLWGWPGNTESGTAAG